MLYALPQMTQLVWIVMHEMAIMSRGQRYWRTRRATLDTLEELLGRRPTPKTVTTAWQNLERAGMISHVGTLENGTKVWQMNDDAALAEYARLERIVKSTAGTPLRFAG